MEETWELAVVSGKLTPDWSARHTRLRYQAVLSSLGFLLVVSLGVTSMKIPGLLEFTEQPNEILVKIGSIAFALFSLISFAVQDNIERHLRPNSIKRLKVGIDNVRRNLTENTGLLERTMAAYEDFLSLFDGVESSYDEEKPWLGAEPHWIEDSVYRPIKDELDLALSDINHPLNDFGGDLNASKLHFPNAMVLFEGMQRRAQSIQASIGGVKYTSGHSKGESPKLNGFQPTEIDFEAKHLKRLISEIERLGSDLSAFMKIEANYRFKTYMQSRFLSFTVPALTAAFFLLFGVAKWLV